jgi:superfamily I DNA and/or RNA helicase
MTTLLEIEAAIKQLPERDARKLAAWLQAYLDERWDRQIEEDLTSGKLDILIAQAEADMNSNGTISLRSRLIGQLRYSHQTKAKQKSPKIFCTVSITALRWAG